MRLTDRDGQPLAGFHLTNNAIKAVNVLYGICMGIVSDGKVNEREVLFLDTWLKDNAGYLGEFPLNVVANTVNDILADGKITQEECLYFYEMLGQLVGGTPEETGAAGGLSTQFAVEQVDFIDFPGQVFCFTGKFVYGSRNRCHDVTESLGSVVSKTVTKKLDYLVIGALSSRDWVASSHGRKIEKALYYQQQGTNVKIIVEEDWVNCLSAR